MLSIDLKKLTKISLITAILTAMIFGYFCINIFTHHQMELVIKNNVSSIVRSAESCCSTTFSKYSESLRSNFNFPPRINDYLLAFVASLALVFVVNSYFRDIINNGSLLHRLFLRQNPDILIFNSLKLAFSNGIINSKTF